MAFNGYASLALQVHVVKQLVLKITIAYGIGGLKQAVGQGAFPVVDMGNYAEVPYVFHSQQNYN